MKLTIIQKCLIGLILFAAIIQLSNVTFGLPGHFEFDDNKVDYWYNDEDKEIAHIQSYIEPKSILSPYNYPPLQYLLVAAANWPYRLFKGQLPAIWWLCLNSRIISVLSVLGSILLVYLIFSRFTQMAGLCAAAFYSFAPITLAIGNDMKPIALSGFFILGAIYYSFRIIENGYSKKVCILIGCTLGFALMCSHLAVTFLHIPIIVFSMMHLRRNNKDDYEVNPTLTQNNNLSPLIFRLIGIFVLLMVATVWYVLSYHRSMILKAAAELYRLQEHSLPFNHHLPAVQSYVQQMISVSMIVLVITVLLNIYLFFRHSRYCSETFNKILVPLEITYGQVALCISTILTIGSALNHLLPLSILNFINSSSTYTNLDAGYYGLYPGSILPPGFYSDIIPQSMGFLLYLLSLVSLIVVIFTLRNNKHVIILILFFAPFALQILFWNNTFRASRFAYNLLFLGYGFSGIFVAQLIAKSNWIIRSAGYSIIFLVSIYTLTGTIIFHNTKYYENDARYKTAVWLKSRLTKPVTVGIASVADLPRNLGPIDKIKDIRFTDFSKMPEYCVMDGFEYTVFKKYFEMIAHGYKYTRNDWWPSRNPPDDEIINVYDLIVNEKSYKLIQTIETKNPSVLGIKYKFDLLRDPAFNLHHWFYIFKRSN